MLLRTLSGRVVEEGIAGSEDGGRRRQGRGSEREIRRGGRNTRPGVSDEVLDLDFFELWATRRNSTKILGTQVLRR